MKSGRGSDLIKQKSKDVGRFSVNPSVWAFFVVSLLIFLTLLGAANISLSWLSPIVLNNIASQALPWPFQTEHAWRDVISPLLCFAIVIIGINFVPRNKYTIALANGTLLFAATRYIIWRLLTINTAHPLSFTLSLGIYIYELLFTILLYAEFFPATTFDPLKRTREANSLTIESSRRTASVDIFITTYNEPVRQIRRCILASKSQSYQNTTIYVLDDGNRQDVRALCQELKIEYVYRTDNVHRKAGNLNHALPLTNGEFILILDCDFIPFAHFIHRVIGFFTQEDVAIVQTPQHYFMPDFHARNLGIEALMPSDVDMFYNYQQVIRDNINAVICVGTSYMIRRSALHAVGGYVTTCIIEDYQTGTRLLTNGWRIIYLNELLSVGETPGNLRDYLEQRLRWLQGNLQILLPSSRLNVLQSASITAWQRIFYASHYISNFMPVGRAFFIFIPLISLYLGNQLIIAPIDAYLAYALPFILLLHTIPAWCSAKHTHQLWSEVYETIMCIPWTIRLCRILINPTRIYGRTVTPKGHHFGSKTIDLDLARHLIIYISLFLIFYLTRFGLPLLDLSFQFYAIHVEGQEIMVFWTIYNFTIVLVALLCCIEKPFRRLSERFPADYIVRIADGPHGINCWGATLDISETGASMAITTRSIDVSRLMNDQEIEITLIDFDLSLHGTVVRVVKKEGVLPVVSVQFRPLSEAQESRLLGIIYSPDNRYIQRRTLSVLESVLLFVRSLMNGNSLLQLFK